MKSHHPLLYRAMPYMLLAFLLLAVVQLVLLLHVAPQSSWAGLLPAKQTLLQDLDWGRPWYLPLGLGGCLLALLGLVFEVRGNKLARLGLQRRKNPLTILMDGFTNRRKLEKHLVRTQRESTLDAGELAGALRARVAGHDATCEDIAQLLRQRLAQRALRTPSKAHRARPVGIFLFAGPAHTGKTWLARQLALLTDRAFVSLDMRQFSGSMGMEQLFGAPALTSVPPIKGVLTEALREHPASVIYLDEIEHADPEILRKILSVCESGKLLDSVSGQDLSLTDALFILAVPLARLSTETLPSQPLTQSAIKTQLRQAGVSEALIEGVERLYLFPPLRGMALAQRVAHETEAMIESYGLHVQPGGVNPALFQPLLQTHPTHEETDGRALLQNVENMLGDSLITARQQGHDWVRLISENGQLRAVGGDLQAVRLAKPAP